MTTNPNPAAFAIGGDLPVGRIGYGAMQLTGPGAIGFPEDVDAAIAVLRRAVELGVTLIDTADAYGPFVTDELIRRALHPYADDLVIAGKVGTVHPSPEVWLPLGRPEYLRQQAELSLRTLGIERFDLLQLHRVDPAIPLEDQVGELATLREEGKVRHIGLSEVTVEQVRAAQEVTPIASVQNRFNLLHREGADVLEHAEAEGMAFIPWFPLTGDGLADQGGPVAHVMERTGASMSQLALAWLLHRSPAILPIPGTRSTAHLEENLRAAEVDLSEEDCSILDAAGPGGA